MTASGYEISFRGIQKLTTVMITQFNELLKKSLNCILYFVNIYFIDLIEEGRGRKR